MKPEIKKAIEEIKQKEINRKKEEFEGFTKFEKFVWYFIDDFFIGFFFWICMFVITLAISYIYPKLICIFLLLFLIWIFLNIFSRKHKLDARHFENELK